MKYLGIGIIILGVMLLAANAFDIYIHPVLQTYSWIAYVPIALGLLLIMSADKGVGAA